MALPRCPRCYTPIQPDWDHCHSCGLTEAEIEEALTAGGDAEAAAAPPALPPPTPHADPVPPPLSTPPPDDDVVWQSAFGEATDGGTEGPVAAGATAGDPMRAPSPGPAGKGTGATGFGDDSRPRPAGGAKAAPLASGGTPTWVVVAAIGAAVVVILGVILLFRPKPVDQSTGASSGSTVPPLGQVGLIDPKSTSTTSSTLAPTQLPPGRAGWVIFTAPDGSFRAEFPKAPIVQTDMLQVGGNEVPMTSYLDIDGNGGYVVVSVDTPAGENSQQIMQQVLGAWAARRDLQVAESAPGEGRLEPTRDARISGPDGRFFAKAFATPNRVYIVAVGGVDPTAYSFDHLTADFAPLQ